MNIKITPVEKFVSPSFTVSSHLFGSFQIFNILAAATFGLHFNIGIDDIKSAIESYIPENNRSQIVEWHGNTLILDAYNANPSSMELMLKTFIDSPVEKKLVVLGDMLELGNFQKEEHSNIIELVKSSSSLESIFIGHAFLDANDHEDLLLVGSSNEAIVLLDRFKNKGYTILAKGSRGIAVEKAFELTHNTRINTSVSHPIKYYSQPSDFNSWKTIPIVEENDPMVEISNYDNRIITKPMYFEQGLSGALLNCYTRQSIAKKLKEAASKLPDGIGLCVYDAWRPLEVQQNLFDDYIIHLKSQHLDLNENELIEKAQTFVSLPSANPNKPSPHYTGGSIDLTLVDLATGNELDMGTEFDDFTERAATIYFEDNGGIEHQDIVRNRRLLYHTLCSVGFTNYHAEWWHFDFGNQWWARSLNTIAIYGPININ